MERRIVLKLFIIVALMATGCNKDDDNKSDQDCLKEENYFEAEFDGETIESPIIIKVVDSGFTLYIRNNVRQMIILG